MKELISRLRTASVVIGNLPEQPGYNGSVLVIDDIEAAEIEKAIDAAVAALEELTTRGNSDVQHDARPAHSKTSAAD